MTTIVVPISGGGSVAGIAPAAKSAASVPIAQGGVVSGLPPSVRTATPATLTTPDAARARVVDSSNTFICHLPHTEGLRWLDEHNTSGAGSIDVRRYDAEEALHPNLWNFGNAVIITIGETDIFRIVLDMVPGYRIDEATKQKIETRGGTGALGVLNSGMCIPEYGWRPEATEDRTFDYGSNPNVGGWYVPSEWHKPIGRLVRQSWRWTYKNRHLPKGLRDKQAQWLWYRDPDSTSGANETCYFIYSFTITHARRIRFKVAGDDTLEFQIDGEIRATTGPGGWKKATTVVLDLSAGTHWVAAKVTNNPGSTGNQNRSGFICSIARVNGDGDVVSWINHSSPATWKIRRQLAEPPGWYNAQILRELVVEQQSRGCAGHAPVTLGFSTVADSSGVAWQGRRELSISVGTQALDYVQQLVESGMDVWMSPSLVLAAWVRRGVDRSGWVRVNQRASHPLDESAAPLPMYRNFIAAKASTGWVTQTDAASVASVGLRETLASLGGSQSPQQTAASVAAMMPDSANPPQTVEVKFSGATVTWQPGRDYFVGDWVGYAPVGATTWARYRVMSIGGEGTDTGHPDWTVQLYKD